MLPRISLSTIYSAAAIIAVGTADCSGNEAVSTGCMKAVRILLRL